MNDTERRVIAIVSNVTRIPEEQIGPTTNLRTELNVDSLQGLQIVAEIESELGVRVPDDQVDFYTSIDSIVHMVEQLTTQRPTTV
jgi:acyl carrier protein